MRLILLIFFCFAEFLNAQDSVSSKSKVHLFFEKQQISLDSVSEEFLFHKVYEWLGTKYRYSGDTKEGVDCSGFTAMLYREVYCTELSGGSKDIFLQVDTISRSELREGDLLFFRIRNNQISHVGVYLGNRKFAHASVHSGVTVSSLDEDYYRKYFYRSGRVRR